MSGGTVAGVGSASATVGSVAVCVFWSGVACPVVGVSEVPWFGWEDEESAACTVRVALADGVLPLVAQGLVCGSVAALVCCAA